MLTEVGPIPLEVPRDRNGKFEPQIVPKHARRVAGFNEAIVSLYAKRLTPGKIRSHLAEIYGVDVSRDLVSRVTDQVAQVLAAWHSQKRVDVLASRRRRAQAQHQWAWTQHQTPCDLGLPFRHSLQGMCPRAP